MHITTHLRNILTVGQGNLISSLAETRGLRIVNFNHGGQRLVRMDRQSTIPTLPDRLAVFILLQDHGVDLVIGQDGTEVRWEPNKILCHFGNGVYPKDERERFYCLMALLDVRWN